MKPRSLLPILLLTTHSAFAFDAGTPNRNKENAEGPGISLPDPAQVMSGASTGFDAGSAFLNNVKALKPRDFSLEAGNNAARKALANQANSALTIVKNISAKYGLPLLSATVQFSETGGNVLGNMYEGNVSGAGVELTNTAASNLTVAAGAAAGGKIFASAGALVGSSVPVVGTAAGAIVGGVVGTVGGAVLTSFGYDAYLKDWVKGSAESVLEPPVDYVEKARQARAEFLRQQQEDAARQRSEAEKKQAENRYGYDIVAGSSDEREAQLAANPLPDIVVPQQEQAGSDPGKGIQVIPSLATIQALVTVEGNDIAKTLKSSETYVFRDGVVSGTLSNNFDISGCKIQSQGSYAGTVRDNVITGEWTLKNVSHCAAQNAAGCVISGNNVSRINEVITFNIDGTLNGRITGGNMSGTSTVSGCEGGGTHHTSSKYDPMAVRGTWRFAK
jgi:hypothetical protein